MTATIFQRPKNPMQSGRARTDRWVLHYERAEPERPDPLTGWIGNGDTRRQVQLSFPSEAAAVAYAEKHGIEHEVLPTPPRHLKIQAYADNFR